MFLEKVCKRGVRGLGGKSDFLPLANWDHLHQGLRILTSWFTSLFCRYSYSFLVSLMVVGFGLGRVGMGWYGLGAQG